MRNFVIIVFFIFGCTDVQGYPYFPYDTDIDTSSGWDSDSSSGTSSDVDTESDTETSTDTETETSSSDSDSDADSDSDSDSNVCPYSCLTAVVCGYFGGTVNEDYNCPSTSQICCEVPEPDADVDTDSDADSDADSDTDSDTDTSVDGVCFWSGGNCFQNQDLPDIMNLEDAFSYCSNLELGGYTDWFLPPVDWLKTLISGCDSVNCEMLYDEEDGLTWSDDCVYSDCPIGEGPSSGCYWKEGVVGVCDMYWTSTGHVGIYVNFSTGLIWFGSGNGLLNVRCVRYTS